jgi:hypothetical protein
MERFGTLPIITADEVRREHLRHRQRAAAAQRRLLLGGASYLISGTALLAWTISASLAPDKESSGCGMLLLAAQFGVTALWGGALFCFRAYRRQRGH